VAEICDLPVERIVALGARLATTRPTAIRATMGIQRHAGGGMALRTLATVPAVTGDWALPGGGLAYSTSGYFRGDRAGLTRDDLRPHPVRSLLMTRLGDVLLDADPAVRALVVYGANPLASNPESGKVRRALAREDLFTVVIEQVPTDTVDYADFVLPSTMQTEHTDVHDGYGHMYLAWNEPAVEPPGECLPHTEIFRRLARAMGLDEPALYDDDLTLARTLVESGHPTLEGLTVERLRQDGRLLRTETHVHAVGHCQRCDTIVEPLISTQWFVRMEELARPAIAAAKDPSPRWEEDGGRGNDGSLQFVPDHFRSVYLNWLENIHDWTVSRQLWWGHRIPVWYCQRCGETIVTEEEALVACPHCGGPVEQDPDVLDTWFSSGLWPFSTLGWPDDTPDLTRYYPSSVMETGYEILFFWVARMVIFGLEVMGELPFHTVYLHGTVRDVEGAKMSKTKGNVMDPTAVTAEYGADALRFALVTQSGPGNDLRLDIQKVEDARNFANKLWNATRFALRPIGEAEVVMDEDGPARPSGELALADRWILSRLDATVEDANRLMRAHQYGEAGKTIREFVWSELCDWYIEAAKVRQRGSAAERQAVAQTLAYAMERSVRLLHPFMPFVTEALWQELPHVGESAMIAAWPEAGPRDQTAETDFGALIEIVRAIRNARTEAGVEPGRWIAAEIFPGPHRAAFETARRELATLARIADDELVMLDGAPQGSQGALTAVAGNVVAILPLAGMVDLEAERDRLRKEIAATMAERDRAQAQLGNEAFVSRAPDQVVAVQRQRLATAEEQISLLERRLAELDA